MIKVYLRDLELEYDVQTLVKAFYPEYNIKVEELKEEIFLSSFTEKHTFIVNTTSENAYVASYHLDKEQINRKFKIQSDSLKAYKNQIKRELYKLLKDTSNKELPWGTLTGVRPTKLALEPLLEGQSIEFITRNYKEQYLCSDEKIDLSIEIANKEMKLLQEIDYKNSYSIYIGIPFCPSTCLYCSFTSYSAEKFAHMIDSYLDALCKEISYAKTEFTMKKLSTIYIGGGTPTTLSPSQLERLLGHIKANFDTEALVEYTVEAGRPDSITREKLQVLKDFGVTRISINPQTMRQHTLDLIGRKHSVESIVETYQMAREIGHNNINMDIIIGLPGETKEDVAYTLEEIKKLDPDSLTVHTLAIKRVARLNQEKAQYKDITGMEAKEMLQLSTDFAKENNYQPYYLYRQKNMADNLENTGYSRPGKECIYNVLIMEEKQTILALGAGSISKFVFHSNNRLERVDNVKSLVDYIKRVDEMIERKKQFIKNNEEELEKVFE